VIRIVVDTNVVVSGVLADEGLPASILDLAANRKVELTAEGIAGSNR
jgi:predicted nucleic acid-binding protein